MSLSVSYVKLLLINKYLYWKISIFVSYVFLFVTFFRSTSLINIFLINKYSYWKMSIFVSYVKLLLINEYLYWKISITVSYVFLFLCCFSDPQGSSCSFTRFSTTSSAPTCRASFRPWSSSATPSSPATSFSSCWEPSHSSHRSNSSATSTSISRWTKKQKKRKVAVDDGSDFWFFFDFFFFSQKS